MAVGAQMKIAHKLRSAEHISKRELQRVLTGSFDASNFQVEEYQMEEMIEGIMKVCITGKKISKVFRILIQHKRFNACCRLVTHQALG